MEALRSSPAARSARWLLDSITVLGFLLVIAAPRLDLWIRPDDSVRSPEKPELRVPAPRPEPPRTAKALFNYPTQYEAWFKDSFGLRDKLLRWNSIVKVFGFGVSPGAQSYFGRDGWLFYTGELSKSNHRGAHPFSQSELEHWARVLESKRALLESLGVRYLYVVASDKESVYSELLPDYMRPIGPTRVDQLREFLAEHAPKVEFFDLRPALVAAKRDDSENKWIYTKLGTHWSGRGSLVALRAVLERMNGMIGGFTPEELDDYRFVEFGGNGDSMATRMYIDDLLPMPIHGYVPRQMRSKVRFEGMFRIGRIRKSEIENSTRPRLVLMHDSFGPHIEQGLGEQCSYLECRWNFTPDTGDLEAAAPAILVDMFVERTLNHLDPRHLMPTSLHPWPGRFTKSKSILLSVDMTLENWGLKAVGGASIGPAMSVPRRRLPVFVKNTWDMIGLPVLTPIPGEVPVLHVIVDSAVTTELSLYYRSAAEGIFVQRNCYRHPIKPGTNDIYMPLDHEGTDGELLLRPGALAGGYQLRDFEIRSVPLPP